MVEPADKRVNVVEGRRTHILQCTFVRVLEQVEGMSNRHEVGNVLDKTDGLTRLATN